VIVIQTISMGITGSQAHLVMLLPHDASGDDLKKYPAYLRIAISKYGSTLASPHYCIAVKGGGCDGHMGTSFSCYSTTSCAVADNILDELGRRYPQTRALAGNHGTPRTVVACKVAINDIKAGRFKG
jgi:hypothetical protein